MFKIDTAIYRFSVRNGRRRERDKGKKGGERKREREGKNGERQKEEKG